MRTFIFDKINEHKNIALNEMAARLVGVQTVRISRSARSARLRGHV